MIDKTLFNLIIARDQINALIKVEESGATIGKGLAYQCTTVVAMELERNKIYIPMPASVTSSNQYLYAIDLVAIINQTIANLLFDGKGNRV
jgi:hypothetical protein